MLVFNQKLRKRRLDEVAAEEKRRKQLDLMTTAFVQPGDTQKEKGFKQQGEKTTAEGSNPIVDGAVRNGFRMISQSINRNRSRFSLLTSQRANTAVTPKQHVEPTREHRSGEPTSELEEVPVVS